MNRPGVKRDHAGVRFIVWAALQLSIAMLSMAILLLRLLAALAPLQPAVGEYVLYAGLIAALGVLPVLNRMQRQQGRGGTGDAGAERQEAEFTRQMVLGMAIAELPAVAGLLYYLLTGDLFWGLGLCALSLAMGFHLMPNPPSPKR